jgi:hypothetical protein
VHDDLSGTGQLLRIHGITHQSHNIDCFCARWDTWLGQHVVYDLGKPMCLGSYLFQAPPDSVRRRFIRECGGSQCEHGGDWLTQVMSSLLDYA